MKLFYLLLFFVCCTVNISKAQTKEIKNGRDVLSAMYEMHKETWYKNFSFKQLTTFYGQDEQVVRTQIWYEVMTLPGKLAIKFDEKQSNNGILFNEGTQYGFANGQLIQQMDRVHDLLVLGFDVYHQNPEVTAEQLINNNYDLTKMYKDEWQGRPVYVVGINEPDTTLPQFWIDAERMVFVRNFTVGRQNTIQEVQFNNYERLGNGWVAPEVIFKANGQIGLLEEYSEMKLPEKVNPRIFDPETFVKAKWD